MGSLLISPIILVLIALASVFLGCVALFYIRKFQLNIKVNIKSLENGKDVITAMVSSIKDGIIMVDGDLNIIINNKSAFELLGLEQGAGVSQVFEVVGGKADLKLAVESVLKSQMMVSLPEINIGERSMQIDVEPVKDGGSYLLGAVIVLHDLTKEKQLERLREEFVAMMVHELRTPLTTIFYSVDGLVSGLSTLTKEVLIKNLQTIKSTTNNMLTLVNDLLDVAKVEAGKFEITKTPSHLNTLIDQIISSIMPLAQQKGLQINSQISPDIGEVILDPNRIGQVLNNLLSNSIKYTNSGSITISARRENGSLVLSVSDTGDGINPGDLNQLFSKFRQLGKGKTGEKGGTGLGLVISKGIVEAHGGKIWAESKGIGQGSTFTFTIPLG